MDGPGMDHAWMDHHHQHHHSCTTYIPPRVLLDSWARTGVVGPATIASLACMSKEWYSETTASRAPLLLAHFSAEVPGFASTAASTVSEPDAGTLLLSSYVRAPVLLRAVRAIGEASGLAEQSMPYKRSLRCMLDGSLWWWDGKGSGEYHRIVHTIIVLSMLMSWALGQGEGGCSDVRPWGIHALFHFVGLAYTSHADPQIRTRDADITRMLLEQLDEAMLMQWSKVDSRMQQRLRWLLVRVRNKVGRFDVVGHHAG